MYFYYVSHSAVLCFGNDKLTIQLWPFQLDRFKVDIISIFHSHPIKRKNTTKRKKVQMLVLSLY